MLPRFHREAFLDDICSIRADIISFLKGEPYGNKTIIHRLANCEMVLCNNISQFSVIYNDFELIDTLIICRPETINWVLNGIIFQVEKTTMLEYVLRTFNPVLSLNVLTLTILKEEDLVQDFTEVLFAYPGIDILKPLLSTCKENNGPFCTAIWLNRYKVVNRLLELGFEPSLENGTLAVKSYYACPSILDQLVVYGVDINRPFRDYTYLQVAAWNRDHKRVKLILDRGANTMIMDPYRRVALVLWYHYGFTSCLEVEEPPNYKMLAVAIPSQTSSITRRYIENVSAYPTEKYFSRRKLDQIPEPPRELFDHTPVDYVSAFLEYENRPYARLLVDYILSKY